MTEAYFYGSAPIPPKSGIQIVYGRDYGEFILIIEMMGQEVFYVGPEKIPKPVRMLRPPRDISHEKYIVENCTVNSQTDTIYTVLEIRKNEI